MAGIALIAFVVFVIQVGNRQQEVIRIGAILPLTGPAAEFGKTDRNTYQLGIDEVNLAGGINGQFIKLFVEDGQGDPKSSIAAFQKLHSVHDVQIFLTTVSSVSMALSSLVEQNQVIMFTDAAHPGIAKASKFIYRHSNIATDEAAIMLKDAMRIQKNLKLGILTVNDDYGFSIESAFRQLEETRHEFELVGVERYNKTETNFRSIVTRMLLAKPNYIVVAGYGKSMGIAIRHLRELGYEGEIITSIPFIATPSGMIVAGPALKNVSYLTFAYEDKPKALEFGRKYQDRYSSPPLINAVLDYSIFQLLKNGLVQVGTSPKNLQQYMNTVSNFNALSGNLTVSEEGDIPAELIVKRFTSNDIQRILEGK